MINHVKEYLENYIDGLLTEDEKAQVEEHLKTCDDCARLFKIMPAVYDALPKMSEIPVSDDFYSKMWASIDAEKQRKSKSWISISRPSFAVALSFGLLFFICFYFKIGPCEKREQTVVNPPTIVVPGIPVNPPDNKLTPKQPVKTAFKVAPADYNSSDYPLIIAMAPGNNNNIISRGNDDNIGKLFTISPLEIDNLTGKLVENEKISGLESVKIGNVKLPGKNDSAVNKVKDIMSESLQRRGIKVVDNDDSGRINAVITDNGKEYRITIVAVSSDNDTVALGKVTADIEKESPGKDILNTSQNQNWLISQFVSNNFALSGIAKAELLKCGDAVIKKLHEQMLISGTPAEAEKVASLIGDIGSKDSVGPLVRMMRDRRLADAAAIALRRIGKKAMPELKKAWTAENRSEAHMRLLDIFADIKDKSADEMLHKGLKDQFPSVRESAALILAKRLDKAALPVLCVMMKNLDGDVRLVAVEAVAKYKDSSTISKLSAVAIDSYEETATRRAAINGIAGIKNKAAAIELVNISKILMNENNVPESLLDALTNAIIKQNQTAVPAWINELEHGSTQSKQLAARMLSLIADEHAVEALIKAASSGSDISIRIAAVESLGIIKNEKALLLLKNVLNDENEEVRNTAKVAWKNITGKEPSEE